MRRTSIVVTVLAVTLLSVTCGDDDTGSGTAQGDSPATTGATTDTSAAVATTSAATATTTAPLLADLLAAEADLEAYITENALPGEHLASGTLGENGAFLDELPPDDLPEVAFDARGFVDSDGVVWVVLLGDMTVISNAWIELDAVDADFNIVAEASVIGTGEGALWVETAEHGIVVEIGPPPAVAAFRSLQGEGGDVVFVDGIAIRTSISMEDEWDHISGWVYASYLAGRRIQVDESANYLYEHFRLTFDELAVVSPADAVQLLDRYADRYREAVGPSQQEDVLYLLDDAFEDVFEDLGDDD